MAFLASIAILALFASVGVSAEDNSKGKDTSLNPLTMAASNPSQNVSVSDGYPNKAPSGQTSVPIVASNLGESSRIWAGGNNQSLNGTNYLTLMEVVKIQYLEDLNYSSYILDEFVNKSIEPREAMTATLTLFALTEKTANMVDLIEPPSNLKAYHDNSKQALVYLEGYLWNMVKFYETNRRVYAMLAHDNFNKSVNHYARWTSYPSKRINTTS
jgi:hypothetical protein